MPHDDVLDEKEPKEKRKKERIEKVDQYSIYFSVIFTQLEIILASVFVQTHSLMWASDWNSYKVQHFLVFSP